MSSFDFESLVAFLTALFEALKKLAAALGIDLGGEEGETEAAE